MKKIIELYKGIPAFAGMTMLLLALPVFAQTPALPSVDVSHLIAGEHFPLIYTGSGSIEGAADSYTSAWQQIGYAPGASSTANRNVGIFNPEYFTLGLKLACSGAGDSAAVELGYFETAYDTTEAGFWNADSSNRFIEDGIFGHNDYGVWRFETQRDTARTYAYPLRVLAGGYVRLTFSADIADTTAIDWRLTCEH
ncbi:hypothetical protein ACFLQV_01440 [Calditrichota bacterium]